MDDKATIQTQSRYNRSAPVYDLMEGIIERVAKLMDLLDPFVVRLMGPHINRRTVENVRKAGLEIERVEELAPGGLVKLIVTRTKQGQN